MVLSSDTELIYLPKVICLVSRIPFLDLQKQILLYFYHNLIIPKSVKNSHNTINVPRKLVDFFNALHLQHGIDKMEKVWDEQITEFLKNLKIGELQVLYKVKETHLAEFYISLIFTICKIKPSNQELTLYKPFQNNTKVHDIFKFRLNERITLSYPYFSYKSMFRRLSIDNIIKILKYIILEKQIIFFSSKPGEITQITETLLSLITPLTWYLTYIPFVPMEIWDKCLMNF